MTTHNYSQLIHDCPDRLLVKGHIEYVQNPYLADSPIIKIDRINKTAEDTDIFLPEELWKITSLG